MDSIDPFPNQDMFTETLEKLEDQLKPLAKSNIIIPEAVLSGTRMSEEEIEQLKSKYEVMQHFKGICNSSLLPRFLLFDFVVLKFLFDAYLQITPLTEKEFKDQRKTVCRELFRKWEEKSYIFFLSSSASKTSGNTRENVH